MHSKETIQNFLESFVSEKLCMIFGCRAHEFSLTKTALGINTHVFYLDIRGRQPLIIKAFPSRRRFKTYLLCSQHLAERDIPIPRMLYAEEHKIFNRTGLHIVCEGRVQGRTIQDCRSRGVPLEDTARLFSRLNSVRRSAWGTIANPRQADLYGYLRRKLHDKLNAWRHIDPDMPPRLTRDISHWFAPWRGIINSLTSFSLSHGDPNPGNIIVSNAGRIALLDIGHLRYLPRGIDYYKLQGHLCGDDRAKASLLYRAYVEHMPSEDRDELESLQSFCKMYVLVAFSYILAHKLSGMDQTAPYYAACSKNLMTTKRMITEIMDTQ